MGEIDWMVTEPQIRFLLSPIVLIEAIKRQTDDNKKMKKVKN